MASDQPQPGDIWERDGERRVLVVIPPAGTVTYKLDGRREQYLTSRTKWDRWQSGATLIQRREPTP